MERSCIIGYYPLLKDKWSKDFHMASLGLSMHIMGTARLDTINMVSLGENGVNFKTQMESSGKKKEFGLIFN
jgi:hypothetical protein